MDDTSLLSCRGCLTKVSGKTQHSFKVPAIKELFVECAAIKILPDDRNLPQQICSECLSKCQQWYAFKNMCHIANEHLLKIDQRPGVIEDDPVSDKVDPKVSRDLNNDLDDDLVVYTFGELIEDPEEETENNIVMDEDTEPLTSDNSTDFDCPVCKAVLPESVHLRNHLKEHYSDQDPKCPICAEAFTRGSKVYAHVVAVHMGCDTETVQVCNNGEPRIEHSSGKDAGTMHTCPICKGRYRELRNHIMEVHVPRGTLACPICSKQFGDRSHLSSHLLMHTNEKPFGCTQCHERFTQKDSLKRHMLKKHRQGTNNQAMPGENGFYKCSLCDRMDTLSQLRIHFVVHTKERPYQCNYCPADFKYKSDVLTHIRKRHSGRSSKEGVVVKKGSIFHNPLPWEEMGYSLDDNSNGGPDKRVSKQPTDKPQCSVCNEVFESRYKLHLHSVIHTGERPYKCTYCEDDFQQKAIGITHAVESHPNEKQDRAIVLKKGTEFGRKLRTLGSTASGGQTNKISTERPNKNRSFPNCIQCNRKFVSTNLLKVHMKTHEMRKTHPFICRECGNSFQSECKLKRHALVHSAAMYKCSICEFAFKIECNMVRHMKRRHPNGAQ